MCDPLDVEQTIHCVKSILDNVRCIGCDEISENNLRYSCGHTVCSACIKEECVICLVPSSSCSEQVLPDHNFAQRVRNAKKLLNTFEAAFNVDVYKRHRLSKQQKIERELFPNCIQADIKYFNKRKSVNNSFKSNDSAIFPGEMTSSHNDTTRMITSINNVENWLYKNEKKTKNLTRTALADLNVNRQTYNKISNNGRKKGNSQFIKSPLKTKKKALAQVTNLQHYDNNISSRSSQSLLEKYIKPYKKEPQVCRNPKTLCDKNDRNYTESIMKQDKDESGIVIDDEPIIIDDSQSQTLDKDKLAWLAVLAQDGQTPNDVQSEEKQVIDTEELPNSNINKELDCKSIIRYKVPFYKKSYILEACKLCAKETLHVRSDAFKSVSINIESETFLTNIKVSDCGNKLAKVDTHSVPIQTHITGIGEKDVYGNMFKNNKEIDEIVITEKEFVSEDLFTHELNDVQTNKSFEKNCTENKMSTPNKHHMTPMAASKCVIIADSDSDSDLNESHTLQVTAAVHRSSDYLDYDVLSELNPINLPQRAQRTKRGNTPLSTDSSDKENFDPNRPKRRKQERKQSKKKFH